MLEEKLQNDMVAAMKDRQAEKDDKKKELYSAKIDAIRAIKSAIQIEKTKGANHELSDDAIVKIISKLSKQYQEDIELCHVGGREDLVEKATREKDVFDSYLPKILSNEDVSKKIDTYLVELNATTMKDMGKVMGALSKDLPNQYDPKFASAYIKEKLMGK
jgi:uncharacterized protein YqeY